MIEKFFTPIDLPLTWAQFHSLPRNPAYKYEYFDGHAWLTPRPKYHHALLDFAMFERLAPAMSIAREVDLRPLAETDWGQLPPAFAAAFYQVQPFASLDDEAGQEAAEACLQATRKGHDGPLIADACLVAADRSDSALLGGALVTLSPGSDPTDWNAWQWSEPPKLASLARGVGRPHLTWIFVSPWHARHGIGSALLDESVRILRKLGYSGLGSTLLVGNESSTLWHWQAGFRLLPHPSSRRVIRVQRPEMPA